MAEVIHRVRSIVDPKPPREGGRDATGGGLVPRLLAREQRRAVLLSANSPEMDW